MNIHRVKLILLLSSEQSAGAERRKHHTQVRKRPRPAHCHSPSQPSLPHVEHTGGMAAPPLPAAPSPAGFCPWHFSSLKNHEESVGNQQKERGGGGEDRWENSSSVCSTAGRKGPAAEAVTRRAQPHVTTQLCSARWRWRAKQQWDVRVKPVQKEALNISKCLCEAVCLKRDLNMPCICCLTICYRGGSLADKLQRSCIHFSAVPNMPPR